MIGVIDGDRLDRPLAFLTRRDCMTTQLSLFRAVTSEPTIHRLLPTVERDGKAIFCHTRPEARLATVSADAGSPDTGSPCAGPVWHTLALSVPFRSQLLL
jgi:hypothetical protein